MSRKVISLAAEGDSLSAIHFNHIYGYGGSDLSLVPVGEPTLTKSMVWWRWSANGLILANAAIAGSRLRTNTPTGTYVGDLTFRSGIVDALIPSNYPGHPRLSAHESDRPARKYIFSLQIGTNPDTTDGTAFATEIATYLAARVSAGYNGIVICTIPDRGDGVIANFDTYRQNLNTVLRSNTFLNQFGVPCVCADFGNTATRFGATGAYNDLSIWNPDTVHPIAAGYALIQATYDAAVNTVKAML